MLQSLVVGRTGWMPEFRDFEPTDSPYLAWDGQPQRRRWIDLQSALRECGGLVTPDELTALLRPHHAQPVSVIARWLVQRDIVSVNWRGETYVPLFQFDRDRMQPRADVAFVMREMGDAFDDWELASWWAEPNRWLGQARPAQHLDVNVDAVLEAARADRFIAQG